MENQFGTKESEWKAGYICTDDRCDKEDIRGKQAESKFPEVRMSEVLAFVHKADQELHQEEVYSIDIRQAQQAGAFSVSSLIEPREARQVLDPVSCLSASYLPTLQPTPTSMPYISTYPSGPPPSWTSLGSLSVQSCGVSRLESFKEEEEGSTTDKAQMVYADISTMHTPAGVAGVGTGPWITDRSLDRVPYTSMCIRSPNTTTSAQPYSNGISSGTGDKNYFKKESNLIGNSIPVNQPSINFNFVNNNYIPQAQLEQHRNSFFSAQTGVYSNVNQCWSGGGANSNVYYSQSDEAKANDIILSANMNQSAMMKYDDLRIPNSFSQSQLITSHHLKSQSTGGIVSKGKSGAKRRRVLFGKKQVEKLHEEFNSKRYLSASERESLAAELKLSAGQVKIWFQNHRYKLKKQAEDVQPEQSVSGSGVPDSSTGGSTGTLHEDEQTHIPDSSSHTMRLIDSLNSVKSSAVSSSNSSGHYQPLRYDVNRDMMPSNDNSFPSMMNIHNNHSYSIENTIFMRQCSTQSLSLQNVLEKAPVLKVDLPVTTASGSYHTPPSGYCGQGPERSLVRHYGTSQILPVWSSDSTVVSSPVSSRGAMSNSDSAVRGVRGLSSAVIASEMNVDIGKNVE